MSRSNYLQRIALVGASGNVGASTLKHLLAENPHVAITIINRSESTATFPASPQITIKKGSYEDASFLQSAFAGQDAAMIALSFMATGSQPGLIEAAAAAGVKWILPNDYAGDGLRQDMFDAVPMLAPKTAARKQIAELATRHEGLKWIGVATNPWTEFSINMGAFGVKVPDRTAVLYSDAGPFNSSSMNQVGLGIARLLSLPLTSTVNPRASLQYYANNFVYISSFSITQDDVLRSVQRATGTTDAEWKVSHTSIKETISEARAKVATGDFGAMGTLLFAHYMGEGLGGDYQTKALEDLRVLGLEEEDLDSVVKRTVANPQLFFPPPRWLRWFIEW